MIAEIKNKDELLEVSSKLMVVTSQFTLEATGLIGNLLDTENFDGINISSASSTIQRNLRNVSGDMEALASSLNNYILDIKKLDTYDFKDILNIDSLDKNSNMTSDEKNIVTKQENNELVIDDVDEEPLFDDEWWQMIIMNDRYKHDPVGVDNTLATLKRIRGEYEEKIKELENLALEISSSTSWKDALVKTEFMNTYNSYLKIYKNICGKLEVHEKYLDKKSKLARQIERNYSR